MNMQQMHFLQTFLYSSCTVVLRFNNLINFTKSTNKYPTGSFFYNHLKLSTIKPCKNRSNIVSELVFLISILLMILFSRAHISSILRGYCTSYPKITKFCTLFQNYQHLFEKWYIHLIVNYSRNFKIALKFQ